MMNKIFAFDTKLCYWRPFAIGVIVYDEGFNEIERFGGCLSDSAIREEWPKVENTKSVPDMPQYRRYEDLIIKFMMFHDRFDREKEIKSIIYYDWSVINIAHMLNDKGCFGRPFGSPLPDLYNVSEYFGHREKSLRIEEGLTKCGLSVSGPVSNPVYGALATVAIHRHFIGK
jgi:hypothetical protein